MARVVSPTRPVLSDGTDLTVHDADRLAAVAARLNNRPRKRLGPADTDIIIADLKATVT
ncbi:hypothetical protein Val02_52380 [Virgisporangium aliadipatigenens]|uniref:Uncharacterized protein n=1 Tax=Virgisporangium aliadipatigenens TaxID=741659 RepID=A0A8J3YQ04_9ACTN|nr:hypothetical protein Val02_52380 [Virgisporangium aliadipatigenens]